MRHIKKLIIHCSASPRDRGDTASTIHNWHLANGWTGIGYHWVIDGSGKLEAGRPWYWEGAHCRGHNHDSIGICLIGVDDFSGEQIYTLRELVGHLLSKWPDAAVMGHCELDDSKTCPNFDVSQVLEGLF